jgi:hypothetical protein
LAGECGGEIRRGVKRWRGVIVLVGGHDRHRATRRFELPRCGWGHYGSGFGCGSSGGRVKGG